MTGSSRPPKVVRRPARHRVGALSVVAATLLATTGCRVARRLDDDLGVTTTKGGELVGLQAMDGNRSQREVPPGAFCGKAPSVLAGGSVLDCQLIPLGNPGATVCASPSAARGGGESSKGGSGGEQTVPARPCTPLPQEVSSQTVGWMVLAAADQRQLSIFLGPRPSTASNAGGTPVYLERFRASLVSTKVSELAVCPADLDGDGAMELVVLARPTDDPRSNSADESAHPELVAVWLAPSGVLESRNPVRSLDPTIDVPRAQGEGCASPAVTDLRYRSGELRLDGEAPSTAPTAGSPR